MTQSAVSWDGVREQFGDRLEAPNRIVERAQRICYEREQNLTPIRRRVLEQLAASDVALSAYALVDRLHADRPVKPAGVYRALDFLIDAGLVRYVALRKAYACCEGLDPREPIGLLVCTSCGRVDETNATPLRAIVDRMAAPIGFDLNQQPIEIAGVCSACRPTMSA